MKNKILIFAFLIFSLLLPIQAQTGWSEPVRVSSIADYAESAITVDNNGVLSAFWFKDIKLEIGYYSPVFFSQSFNGGLNWTAPINITPNNTDQVSWEIRAVTDSKNNIHIIYSKGLESKVLVYKKYNGSTWTDDYVINVSLNNRMLLGVGTTDNLFATWMLNRTTYYMYCDTNADSIAWSIPKKIHPTIDYTTQDFTFDKYNNVYGIQMVYYDDGTYYSPIISKYNKDKDAWVDFNKIHTTIVGHGCAIANSHRDSLYTNTSSSIDQQLQKHITDSLWSDPIGNGSSNNDINRIMFVDRDNVVHVFQVNKVDGNHSLNHTYGKGTTWQTETIYFDPNYYIFWFDVQRKVFEKYDEYYVLYCKSRAIDGTEYNMINFQTKRITTGIEDNTENIPESAVLSQNYPNPFNNSTEITYSIINTSNVKLNIFNIKAEFIQSLVNKTQNKGQHSVIFKTENLNSGIYYYQLEVDGVAKETKKMLYLK